jgi:hypothetical protein
MGVGAAMVSTDWVALTSLWEAPTQLSICKKEKFIYRKIFTLHRSGLTVQLHILLSFEPPAHIYET